MNQQQIDAARKLEEARREFRAVRLQWDAAERRVKRREAALRKAIRDNPEAWNELKVVGECPNGVTPQCSASQA